MDTLFGDAVRQNLTRLLRYNTTETNKLYFRTMGLMEWKVIQSPNWGPADIVWGYIASLILSISISPSSTAMWVPPITSWMIHPWFLHFVSFHVPLNVWGADTAQAISNRGFHSWLNWAKMNLKWHSPSKSKVGNSRQNWIQTCTLDPDPVGAQMPQLALWKSAELHLNLVLPCGKSMIPNCTVLSILSLLSPPFTIPTILPHSIPSWLFYHLCFCFCHLLHAS